MRSSQELGFGVCDAVIGLAMQPINGCKQAVMKTKGNRCGAGTIGFATGLGKGVCGAPLKLGAALTGIPGYGLKGVERELTRFWARNDGMLVERSEGVLQAKMQVCIDFGTKSDGDPASDIWGAAKSAGVGNVIAEKRLWQGFRGLYELRAGGDAGRLVEEAICAAWERLKES